MNKIGKMAIIIVGLCLTAIVSQAQLFDTCNWSFEQGLTNWTAWDSITSENTSTNFAHTGNSSLMFATTPSSSRIQYDVCAEGGVDKGETYNASVWYYLPQNLSSNEALGLNMTFYSVDTNTWNWSVDGMTHWDIAWGPDQYGPDTSTVGAWAQLGVSGTVPENANAIQVGMQVMGCGSTVYFDDVSINPISLNMLAPSQALPEPSTFILSLLGLSAFLLRRRSRRNRRAK